MKDSQYELKSLNLQLTAPIAFNCWKHHVGFIKKVLNDKSNIGNENFIREVILFIGESQFDLYAGVLDEQSISAEILQYLKSINAFEYKPYTSFIHSNDSDFKCISLSDGSTWTLRLGQGDDRYIHIHPGRHSKKTMRVKSSTFKTVLAFLLFYDNPFDEISVDKINFVRHRIVKLPTLKPNSSLIAISRTLDLFIA
jgi:hypothetical protein